MPTDVGNITAHRMGSFVDRARAIAYVLCQEASVSLGLAGRKLRLALEALDRFDRSPQAGNLRRRAELKRNAAYLFCAYVIQREALGLRIDPALEAELGVSREIHNSMGISSEAS